MRIIISTSYRENSIVNIASILANKNHLKRFYTTLYLASWEKKIKELPVFGVYLAKEFGRRGFSDIPVDKVSSIVPMLELFRVIIRRVLRNSSSCFTSELMYRVKERFDARVAKQIKNETNIVFIGMYGASLNCFKKIRDNNGVAVLNFVNSHPREHNRLLEELAGLKSPHHELMPEWFAAKVEEEIKLAHLILVPSQFVARQLVSRGVSENAISIIPYGVNLEMFSPVVDKKKKSVLECLYVGQISYRKGVNVLIDAARQCKGLSVRFRLVGPIVSRELLTQLPENVIYEGSTLPGGVAKAMQSADIFILPTLEDSYALVVLEAMASGLAVITTENAGAAEVLTNNIDGIIVSPGSSTEISKAIYRLVEDDSFRNRLGASALQTTLSGAYSWDAYGDKVLQVINTKYSSLIVSKNKAPYEERGAL